MHRKMKLIVFMDGDVGGSRTECVVNMAHILVHGQVDASYLVCHHLSLHCASFSHLLHLRRINSLQASGRLQEIVGRAAGHMGLSPARGGVKLKERVLKRVI